MSKETLCWDCKNAIGKCTWSQCFVPIKGWKAKPTTYDSEGMKIKSFLVKECPEFKPDSRTLLTRVQITKIIGVSLRQLFRYEIDCIIKQLAMKDIKAMYDSESRHFFTIHEGK